MLKKSLFMSLSILFYSGTVFAQEQQEEFKPYGEPLIRIFTNYHSTWTGNEADKGFEIQRAYFGYQAYFSEKFSGRLILDVGDPKSGELKMTAYLKNAFVQYKDDRLTASIGMIGLNQFKMQEDLWGGRYLYKSFMDEHKFGPSADLGAFVSYRILEILSADLTIANGEGYKSLESDSILKYSAGITLAPLSFLDLRFSYDYMGKESPQQTLAFYAGYSAENLRIGAEYNYQMNHKMVARQDLSGLSFYGSYQYRRFRFFGRFDQLSSPRIGTETDPWNFANDGQLFLAGVEFNPVKGIKVTPNYQGWLPADGGLMLNSAYLSLEIRF